MELTINNVTFVYEDREIPYAGEVFSICLGVVARNSGLEPGDPGYIIPLVTKVGNCRACRRLIEIK